jgi:hypothetical protein
MPNKLASIANDRCSLRFSANTNPLLESAAA